jgi:hypothetical protein
VNKRRHLCGFSVLGARLMAPSVSSYLADVALLATVTEFTLGYFDGLPVVAFAAAIWLPVRSGRSLRA